MKINKSQGFFTRNRKIIPIYISSMLFATGFMSVVPSLPFLALNLKATPFEVALVISLGPLMGIFASFVMGSSSDFTGRKPVMVLCCLIYALSYFSFYFIETLGVLYLARIFGGFGAFWNAVNQASISESVNNKDKVQALGLLGASFGIGIVLGMSFSAVMLSFDLATFHNISFYSSAIIIIAMVYNLIFYKESIKQKTQFKFSDRLTKLKNIRLNNFIPSGNLIPLFAVVFLFHLTFTGFEGTLALFASFRFEYDAAKVSQLIALGGIAGIVGNLIVARINKLFGEVTSAKIASLINCLAMVVFIFATNFQLLVLAIVLVGLGTGIFLPCQQSLIAKRASRNQALKIASGQEVEISNQGKNHGINQSLLHLARVIGPIFAALLFQNISIYSPYYSAVISFILIFIAISIYWTNLDKE